MNRLEQGAHETLLAHEARQRRYAAGYPPREPLPMGPTWAPVMTEQKKKEREQYIKEHGLPF